MNEPSAGTGPRTTHAQFPSTLGLWTEIIDLARDAWDSPRGRAALDRLCELYRDPIYSFLRRQFPADRADDLTQQFFFEHLRRQFLKNVHRSKGRFRTFLLACVRNFLRTEHNQRTDILVPVPDLPEPPAESVSSGEPAFDRDWAIAIVREAFRRLEAGYTKRSRAEVYRRLLPFLTGEEKPAPMSDVAAALRMSDAATRKALHDLRRALRDTLRQVVAETVSHPAQVDDELRYILRASAQAGAMDG